MTTFCFARFEEFNSLTCSLLDVNIFLFDLSSRFAPTSVDEANTFDVEDGNTPQHPCGRCANGAGDPKDHHEQHGSLVPSGQQVTGPQHGWFAALVNALEYTGFQACSKMPMEIQHHLGQILEGQHPLQQGVQIPYWGSKTPEAQRQHCGPRVHQQQHQLWALCGRVQQLSWWNNGRGPANGRMNNIQRWVRLTPETTVWGETATSLGSTP